MAQRLQSNNAMKRRGVPLALAFAVVLATTARHGQALEPDATEALSETLQVLHEQPTHGGAVPGVPPNSDLAHTLQGSPELTQELYDLAADVFREITENAGGDASKMGHVVEGGRSDPAGFAESLSPATRERLRAFAQKIEDHRR